MSPHDLRYYIAIENLDTEQKLFVGIHRGLLVPILQGIILDHASVTDAGRRLSKAQIRLAYRDAGHRLPKSAYRNDDNVFSLSC